MQHNDLHQRHSLHRQIKATKAELVQNKKALFVQSDTLTRKLHAQLTTPATFCIAGLSGFLLAEFNYRPARQTQNKSDDKNTRQTQMNEEITDRAINNERQGKTSGKASSGQFSKRLSEEWSMANINRLLNSGVYLMTLVNSSLLSLEKITHNKPQDAENLQAGETVSNKVNKNIQG